MRKRTVVFSVMARGCLQAWQIGDDLMKPGGDRGRIKAVNRSGNRLHKTRLRRTGLKDSLAELDRNGYC